MKVLLLFLNVLAFVSILGLMMAHWRYRPPPPPPILASRPTRPKVNPPGLLARADAGPAPAMAVITGGDLFDPARGQAEAAPERATAAATAVQNKKLEQLELLGLVRMGSLEGAIIHDRGGKLKKKFFKVNDADDIEGFKLLGVDPDANTATLGAAGREYELKLERSGKSSEQRRAQAKRQDAIVTLDESGKPVTPAATTPGTRPGAPATPAAPASEDERQAARQRAIEAARKRAAEQRAAMQKRLEEQRRQQGNAPGQ